MNKFIMIFFLFLFVAWSYTFFHILFMADSDFEVMVLGAFPTSKNMGLLAYALFSGLALFSSLYRSKENSKK
ncbi:hypothetical protein [Belliella aquatica]|uniref:hypothetical protein n=1 Tax=Belliella aquatica TaxID=1323734 RepID=UPI00166AA9E9|nr:hypothetical protein [Belliella aquatica]MCH7407658.1 hypothetical protein [Belliella aquatica]